MCVLIKDGATEMGCKGVWGVWGVWVCGEEKWILKVMGKHPYMGYTYQH